MYVLGQLLTSSFNRIVTLWWVRVSFSMPASEELSLVLGLPSHVRLLVESLEWLILKVLEYLPRGRPERCVSSLQVIVG